MNKSKNRKPRIDKEFVTENWHKLAKAAIDNAKKKQSAASLLMKEGLFSEAQALLIVGLEELAKATLLAGEDIWDDEIRLLLSHEAKCNTVMSLSATCYNFTPTDENFSWAQSRIPEMREDCLYTRLTVTPGDKFSPDDSYWRKRAKSFYRFLSEAIPKVEKSIEDKADAQKG